MDDALHQAAVDPRPRALLERYASLVGGMTMELGPELLQVELPTAELRRLGTGERLLVALSPAALDGEPEAEILVMGSALLARLIAAVRERGGLDDRGLIPATEALSAEAVTLAVPVEGVAAGQPEIELVVLPVGRLLARICVHSGASVTERLVESPIVDLAVGQPVLAAVAAACEAMKGDLATDPAPEQARKLEPRPAAELLPLLFDDLQRQAEVELGAIAREAGRASAMEQARLDAYYQRMLDEIDVDEEPHEVLERKAEIETDRARRLEEERRRAAVKVVVHPVQLVQWKVLTQRAEWELQAPSGARGRVVAARTLAGASAWNLACPSCGATPDLLRVCHEGHVACQACSDRCGVCGEGSCRAHGLSRCELEEHPVCARHVAACASCSRQYCEAHSATCRAHDHTVCTSCLVACARCHLPVCQTHATRTHDDAPLGARWLCAECTVSCEGGSNERIGLDEVERCSSCERHICRHHAVECQVDGRRHCSRHLRRSDKTGRLVCDEHRASCADEPHAILASDEVAACASCERLVCEAHSGVCTVDGLRHCSGHLLILKDQPGKQACSAHRTSCAIDEVAFSLSGTTACAVCQRRVCDAHLARCGNCARGVCVEHVEQGKCLTCSGIQPDAEPDDAMIAAAIEANRGEPLSAKEWRTARDASHTVVELDLGWRRRLVFSVRHGETRPATAIYHSLFGSVRRR